MRSYARSACRLKSRFIENSLTLKHIEEGSVLIRDVFVESIQTGCTRVQKRRNNFVIRRATAPVRFLQLAPFYTPR